MTEIKIRNMKESDREDVLRMMRVFYASDAILTNGSEEIFTNDFNECVSDSPFLEGFVFTEDEVVKGYSMIAHSFSTEFGKPCVWVEDIYLESDLRGRGLASDFFILLNEYYPDAAHRLEVETENEPAVKSYFKNGFEDIPYVEMIRNKQ